MSHNYRDQALWPVYIIIRNLKAKTWQSQKRSRPFFLSSIPIIHERSEDANNQNIDLKAKIYLMILKTILQHIYPNFYFIDIKKRDTNHVASLLKNKDSIKLVYVNDNKKSYYLVLAGLMVD